uniref:Uncharacterized protein n=1 Tax=Physcomitrium patens TaxID=3218 RepID=A0A2K1J7N8_PHYPA|nr:hypothetical protein PHYPA_020659 [Physcomitrium patens]
MEDSLADKIMYRCIYEQALGKKLLKPVSLKDAKGQYPRQDKKHEEILRSGWIRLAGDGYTLLGRKDGLPSV